MEMKWKILFIIPPLLTGCTMEHNAYRLADVTLNGNEPRISVSNDATVKSGQAKLLILSLSARDAKGQMQEVWKQDNFDAPLYTLQAGECIPVNYRFKRDEEYSVTVITAQPADNVAPRRLWSRHFKLNDLAPK
ncbi:putative T6SS immunity periplasmic lipoprotein [Kosakonia sp. ML.JS2a]|uniref:putative T6SS immunity periplasmic lipoprotein n=1 Tax=Kosakonia sp. ML.JS2a TaxID=2980557 RepID=UPI0021DA01EB|nr:putative T6SS immunity periplasmic lipoprotein [Kosakonia sp. ML.JS2a]